MRTLNIACLNPDSMKEEQTQREIIKGLTRENTHSSNPGHAYYPRSKRPTLQLPNRYSMSRKQRNNWSSKWRNIDNDPRKHATSHNADNTTRQPSSMSGNVRCRIRNANPNYFNIFPSQWPRRRATTLGGSKRDYDKDM